MIRQLSILFHIVFITLSVFIVPTVIAQISQLSLERDQFFFDVVIYKGKNLDSNRLDIFVQVPFKNLQKLPSGNDFYTHFIVEITVKNTTSGSSYTVKKEKKLSFNPNEPFLDGRGNSEIIQFVQSVTTGDYKIDVVVYDELAKTNMQKSRQIRSEKYSDFSTLSSSSILLLADIEQNDSKFVISPHLSDNISQFSKGFFSFVQLYSQSVPITVDVIITVENQSKQVVFTSQRKTLEISKETTPYYDKVDIPKNIPPGRYTLKIQFLKKGETSSSQNKNVVYFTTSRSIYFERSVAGLSVQDISKAIRQLRYVASSSEIEEIEKLNTDEAKFLKFDEFWRKIDPTPTTNRNEAFEQFYARVERANELFRQSGEGWLTDMGMVYIIFGPPANTQIQNFPSDRRQVLQWSYPSRQFTFVDFSGFNDFRLSQPLFSTDKYLFQE